MTTPTGLPQLVVPSTSNVFARELADGAKINQFVQSCVSEQADLVAGIPDPSNLSRVCIAPFLSFRSPDLAGASLLGGLLAAMDIDSYPALSVTQRLDFERSFRSTRLPLMYTPAKHASALKQHPNLSSHRELLTTLSNSATAFEGDNICDVLARAFDVIVIVFSHRALTHDLAATTYNASNLISSNLSSSDATSCVLFWYGELGGTAGYRLLIDLSQAAPKQHFSVEEPWIRKLLQHAAISGRVRSDIEPETAGFPSGAAAAAASRTSKKRARAIITELVTLFGAIHHTRLFRFIPAIQFHFCIVV